jgi:hypothetical protein
MRPSAGHEARPGPDPMRTGRPAWSADSRRSSSPVSSIRFVGAISSPSGGGMMVVSGDVAIKGRASGSSHGLFALIPVDETAAAGGSR